MAYEVSSHFVLQSAKSLVSWATPTASAVPKSIASCRQGYAPPPTHITGPPAIQQLAAGATQEWSQRLSRTAVVHEGHCCPSLYGVRYSRIARWRRAEQRTAAFQRHPRASWRKANGLVVLMTTTPLCIPWRMQRRCDKGLHSVCST